METTIGETSRELVSHKRKREEYCSPSLPIRIRIQKHRDTGLQSTDTKATVTRPPESLSKGRLELIQVAVFVCEFT